MPSNRSLLPTTPFWLTPCHLDLIDPLWRSGSPLMSWRSLHHFHLLAVVVHFGLWWSCGLSGLFLYHLRFIRGQLFSLDKIALFSRLISASFLGASSSCNFSGAFALWWTFSFVFVALQFDSPVPQISLLLESSVPPVTSDTQSWEPRLTYPASRRCYLTYLCRWFSHFRLVQKRILKPKKEKIRAGKDQAESVVQVKIKKKKLNTRWNREKGAI